MMQTDRNPDYRLMSFPQYLQSRGLIKGNTYTLRKNFKGGNSVLQVGLFDTKFHPTNYTRFTFPDSNYTLYSIRAYEVAIGNFSLLETIGYYKSTPVIIDNHFPYILVQTTEESAGDYYQGNMSDGFADIRFRQLDTMNNSLQAYFP
jgi:hypothetical protein